MADALFWSNVGIDVQTALATAITINGITKDEPGVVSYTGTDPANGDYVLLEVNGMHQVSDRIFRVANVDTGANTFELEGEDTTAYDTFVSGTFQVITFGASMRSGQQVNVSGGEPEFADITTIHDNVRKRAPVVVSPLSFSMTNLFDLGDPAVIEMRKAYLAKSKRAIRLRFGTGARMLLTGYCAAAGVPTGQAQGVVQTTVSIEAQGVPTVYAS